MKAKTKIARLFGILFAFVMVVGMLPTVALATEPTPTPSEVYNFHLDYTTLPYASSELDEL